MSSGIDYPLGETIHFMFTTRAFATGIPGTLSAASVEIYEDGTTTPIQTTVLVTEDINGVTGLNMVPIVATGGNGYNVGASYHIVLDAGLVDSVSVVGEIIGNFTITRASPAVDWLQGGRLDLILDTIASDLVLTYSDTTQIFNDTSSILVDTSTAGVLVSDGTGAGQIALTGGAIDNVTLVATTTDVTNGVGLTAAAVDLVWDEEMALHTTADTAGLVMNEWQDAGRLDLILDTIASDVVLVYSDTAAIDARSVTIYSDTTQIFNDTASILVDTGTTIPDTLEGLVIVDKTSVGATGNTTTAIHLDGVGTYADNELNGYTLVIFGATESEHHVRDILTFTASTDVATVALLPFTPDSSDFFWVLSSGATTELTVAGIADAVWEEDPGDHQTQDTFGQAIGDPAGDATTIYQSVATDATGDNVAIDVIALKAETVTIYSDTTAIHADTITIYSDTTQIFNDTASILVDTSVTIPATLEGLVPIAKASVGSTGNSPTVVHLATGVSSYSDDELNGYFLVLLDSGATEYHVREITTFTNTGDLATVATLPFTPAADDFYWLLSAPAALALNAAIPELLVAQPSATPTLRNGIMLLYMALRNKTDVQTSGTDALEFHQDDGTEFTSKLLTDAGGDYSEAKMV